VDVIGKVRARFRVRIRVCARDNLVLALGSASSSAFYTFDTRTSALYPRPL